MQISLFDGVKKFVNDKPIRLIELFGGYGSQHFALEYLGSNFTQWKLCEWAVKSIQAYKDAHFKNDNTDYSKDLTQKQIIDYLTNKGISSNYNEPMTYEQVKRLGEIKQRQIYNNIKATNNLVNIQQARAIDFEIVDTGNYNYILTYSFPCQDLSKAGKGKGMAKDSGTRSGMLWEVERILNECNGNLPQILLMENVPDVIGTNNIKHFANWLQKLESLGYKCYSQTLNSKDYSIPQTRERCFMISILGDYYYNFPQVIKKNKVINDILENEVDEKYYLSDDMINGMLKTNFETYKLENKLKGNDSLADTIVARFDGCPQCVLIKGKEYAITKDVENYIEWKQKGFLDSDCRAFKDNKIAGTLTTSGNGKVAETLKIKLCNELIKSGILKENYVVNHSYTNGLNGKNPNSRTTLYDYIETTNGLSPTLTTRPDCLGVVVNSHKEQDIYYRIRKYTPKECFRLMGVKDNDFENIAKNQSNASLYHLAGDSIVVTVLMAIFGELLGIEWQSKVLNLVEELKNIIKQ